MLIPALFNNPKTAAMKKLLLLFSFFLTLIANGQTSVYHSFPDSNATWNFQVQQMCFSSGMQDDRYSITLSGDTTINSQAYHKLTTPFIQSLGPGNCLPPATGYQGAVREDSANRKVFFIPPSDTAEQLLYDFTMQVGDTVQGYTQTFASTDDTVLAIDSVLVGSTYRKRWYINQWYTIYFIEGIGSTHGLTEYSVGNLTDAPYYTLTCFSQNAQSLYPNTTLNCDLITSENSPAEILNDITVFPNPSNGSFTIDINNAGIKEIRLTDLLGNNVFQQRINNQAKVNIENLPAGTYILMVIDKDNKTTNRKIISCE